MPVLPTQTLTLSELALRRAHHVLAWIMHFYIHSQPPSESVPRPPIHIPAPIAVPLLSVSRHLSLPPVLTYSDDVLYNWALTDSATSPRPYDDLIPIMDLPAQPYSAVLPSISNIRALTLFTGTRDEAEFYLTSARIELAGVDALALMQAIMDEAFVDDALAHKRISAYLLRLALTVDRLSALLLSVREGCDPHVFYNEVRPWFKGEDSAEGRAKWVFDGLEDYPELGLVQPTELSGPSAGQSSLIHSLDIFLGVDHFSHAPDAAPHAVPSSTPATHAPPTNPAPNGAAFLERMQLYMPRHHRAFLRHLGTSRRPLRTLVQTAATASCHPSVPMLDAYNEAVRALKAFRDAHMRIVALYIIGPARHAQATGGEQRPEARVSNGEPQRGSTLKGTGGTDLVRFLKNVRDRTADAVLDPRSLPHS